MFECSTAITVRRFECQDRTRFPFSGLWVPNHTRLLGILGCGSFVIFLDLCFRSYKWWSNRGTFTFHSFLERQSQYGWTMLFSHPKAQALLACMPDLSRTLQYGPIMHHRYLLFDMPRYHMTRHIIAAIEEGIDAITVCCSSNYWEDFTPVCTTEISMCHTLVEEFQRRSVRGSVHLMLKFKSNVRNHMNYIELLYMDYFQWWCLKYYVLDWLGCLLLGTLPAKVQLIGLSCDSVVQHKAWSKETPFTDHTDVRNLWSLQCFGVNCHHFCAANSVCRMCWLWKTRAQTLERRSDGVTGLVEACSILTCLLYMLCISAGQWQELGVVPQSLIEFANLSWKMNICQLRGGVGISLDCWRAPRDCKHAWYAGGSSAQTLNGLPKRR